MVLAKLPVFCQFSYSEKWNTNTWFAMWTYFMVVWVIFNNYLLSVIHFLWFCLDIIIIEYKPTECTFSKLILQFLIFGVFCVFRILQEDGYIYRYVIVCFTCISVCSLPTRLLVLMHVKHTIPYQYIHPSSWRWTLGFETRRRHQKLKIKIHGAFRF